MDVKLFVFCLTLLLASFLASSAHSKDHEECTYIIYVKTGQLQNSGTNAAVTLELRDIYVNQVNITNLSSHGVMGKRYEYFQRGNLDAFAAKAKCLKGPVCSMAISHNNHGFDPDWYVDSVDVTAISPGRGCRKTNFPVQGWLTANKLPFSTRWGVYLCDEIVHHGSKCSSEE